MGEKIQLKDGYYLDNFHKLAQFVRGHYQHLLSPHDEVFYQTFCQLTQDAQRLWVRLLMRKGPYFRVDKLHYQDIGDHTQAILELSTQALITVCPIAQLPFADSLPLLVKKELLLICQGNIKPLSKRAQIEHYIIEHTTPDDLNAISALNLNCITVKNLDTMVRWQLLFFGNGYQGLSEFIIHDLGIMRYESYIIDPHLHLFKNHEQVNQAITLQQLKTQLYPYFEPEGHLDCAQLQSSENSLKDITAPGVSRAKQRLINKIAAKLERQKEFETALAWYERSDLAPSSERQIRILYKLKHYEKALKLTKKLLKSQDDQEYFFAKQFIGRIESQCNSLEASKLDVTKKRVTTKQKNPPSDFKRIQVILEGSVKKAIEQKQLSIEQAMVDYYQAQGLEAYFVENHLFNALFGLYFWPVIFSPCQDAFINPYQRAPLDFYHPSFYQKRKALIDHRLEQMQQDSHWQQHIIETFEEKYGIANALVAWSVVDLALIKKALTVIPARHLRAIFQLLVHNINNRRNGFPDLLVMDVQQSYYQLIEIKAPNDRLQLNQQRWFYYFQHEHIPAWVCYVDFTEALGGDHVGPA